MTATSPDPPIRRRIRLRVLLSLALLVPPTAACAFGDELNGICAPSGTVGLGDSAVVGTWSGKDAGTLVLAADGTFTAQDLRQKDRDPDQLSGHGTWALNDASPGSTGYSSDLLLTFVQPDGGKTPWNRIDIAPTRPVTWMSYVNGATCDLGSDFRTLNRQ